MAPSAPGRSGPAPCSPGYPARDARSVPLFEFEHVLVDGTPAPRLADLHGCVPAGRLTVVVGPSGAGKSTLLRLCNRLEVPDRGTVRFRGEDVGGLDPLGLRRRVGMVFQRPTPFPGTVAENLRVAQPDVADAAAGALLERVGLDESFLERPALELSGGEAQRVSLARTLATEPEVLLMDEPTSSVDADTATRIERLAREEVGDGVAVLWVTHDREQMRRLADFVLTIEDGRILRAGTAADAG